MYYILYEHLVWLKRVVRLKSISLEHEFWCFMVEYFMKCVVASCKISQLKAQQFICKVSQRKALQFKHKASVKHDSSHVIKPVSSHPHVF
jgi:hypothetical protein